MTEEEVFAGVCECLEDVVEDPDVKIKASDSLIQDLGADSLDLLHLIFSLEQKFDVTIKPREIERRAKVKLGDIPLEVDGVYTPEALIELRKALPEIPEVELYQGLTNSELPRHFRVQTFVNLVTSFLGEQNG